MNKSEKNIDWVLLIFLLLFTNQAIFSLKLLGLALVFLLRPNFKLGIREKKVPLFYLLIILVAAVNWVLFIKDFSAGYIAAFIAGNMLWVFGLLAFHQIRLSLDTYGVGTAHRTIKLFTILHFVSAIGQLVAIMIKTETLNPYIGLDFPYGISTGDNIYGTFFQNSIYNATVSTFLTVYFIFNRNKRYAVLAATCMILVFSNFSTTVFIGIMLGLLGVGMLNKVLRGRYALIRNVSPPGNFGLYLPMFLLYVVAMYFVISPNNAEYFVQKVKSKIFSIDTKGSNNYATQISNQDPDPKAYDRFVKEDYFEQKEKEYEANKGAHFSEVKKDIGVMKPDDRLKAKREMSELYILRLQGKTLSLLETKEFLQASPTNLLFGAGTTRFSSQIAHKMAGFDSSRLFNNYLPRYVSPLYKENHKLLIEERVKLDEEYFSTANFPDSLYNQLFGEYGLLGVFVFIVFYIGYFFKKYKQMSYGVWLLFILLPFAHLSYIFDTMCIMPFFEWLLLVNIKRNS